jgi:hypothetical protein
MVALTSCTESQPIQTTKETIKIGGSAEAYEVMEVLTEAYERRTETIQFEFLQVTVKPVADSKG